MNAWRPSSRIRQRRIDDSNGCLLQINSHAYQIIRHGAPMKTSTPEQKAEKSSRSSKYPPHKFKTAKKLFAKLPLYVYPKEPKKTPQRNGSPNSFLLYQGLQPPVASFTSSE